MPSGTNSISPSFPGERLTASRLAHARTPPECIIGLPQIDLRQPFSPAAIGHRRVRDDRIRVAWVASFCAFRLGSGVLVMGPYYFRGGAASAVSDNHNSSPSEVDCD